MPKTAGVKQKTRSVVKAKTKSPFENRRFQHGVEEDAVHMDGEISQGEEQDMDQEDEPEKDDTERKLEKLLFGDDEGFQEALKGHQDYGVMDLVLQSDEEDAEEDHDLTTKGIEGEDRGLEDVPDADVRDNFYLPASFIVAIGLVVNP